MKKARRLVYRVINNDTLINCSSTDLVESFSCVKPNYDFLRPIEQRWT